MTKEAGIGTGYMTMDAARRRQEGVPGPSATRPKCGQMVQGG
ncbi:MAG: hypothetical protein ACE5QW_00060 [Thermoplasmata archaeon]